MDNSYDTSKQAPEDVCPFLLEFAVYKTPTPDLIGRYCLERDQWVLDTTDGPVPAILYPCAELETTTRVGGEQTDMCAGSSPALITVTSVGGEQDDRSQDALFVLATVTEVGGEQLDSPAHLIPLGMLTLTKVEGEMTDSPCSYS